MFGALIHLSEMTNNEAIARSIPTLGPQLNPQPLEELPACAFLPQHAQDKYFGLIKAAEKKLHVGALEGSLRASLQTFLLLLGDLCNTMLLFALN